MSARTIATLALMALLAVLPPLFFYTGNAFWLDLATRLTILAIAAVSLNLILGYGGLVSFGHAAYVGLGAYAVGIPAYHWLYGGLESLGLATTSGLVQIPLAMVVCALFALITGAICLRTKGVYFIMITMAFAQMVYYAIVSIEEYGGDDGLVIDTRSELPGLNLDDPIQLFALAYVSLVVAMLIVRMITRSRFGMVLRGAKGNAERVQMMGLNPYAYRLTAYVISGAMAGYAGALLGNFTTFISPEMMDWTRSGELMFMVILGGASTTGGPVLGAAAFIILEEVLSHFTIYWHLPFGLLLIAVVLFTRGGLMGFFRGRK
ncbi:branched-chain amino acid ABC transporter permease [Vannielia litorea]|uniref:branched-chain amino acid ABC transporter permease n=1 Tax=Vannielia litorea TaxID=1217970 RepID=UPI001C9546A1|nr:branched-chain amino acid ABC transporter permease [Vannielia litorea]MBY6048961.1 branched-chain amino acid ABC transporter permease [Vannielia litorea]MBY6076375.1 branched-chain amino acid ABC transporter permease [Vannielia litorea]